MVPNTLWYQSKSLPFLFLSSLFFFFFSYGTLQILSILISTRWINTLLNKKQSVFKLFLKAYWLKKIVERQCQEKHYYLIMALTPQQRAVLRAKKAIANGDTNFKPRGEKNKAAFQALKKAAESPPQKRIKITTSDLASLLNFNLPQRENVMNTSDEEEEEEKAEKHDDAMLSKRKAHKEQIKKREERMENELSKRSETETPSAVQAVRLPPKTKAQLLIEKQEDMKRERINRSAQIFKLAHKTKQLDVLHGYKTFEKQEDLLEWLQDVLEQKQATFEIEDDDTRETAWQQEKPQKNCYTKVSDHEAKKLFFESNKFLSQPLQISLIKKDACGTLSEDEKSKLRIQVLQLKVELKQEKHLELGEQLLGRQLCVLHYLKNNKEWLQERGMWEDDSTRELKMKQEEESQKRNEEKVRKMLNDGNVELSSFLKEPSTVTIEEIKDSQPMLALPGPAPTMEVETYSEAYVDDTLDTDVEEPPPCPV